MFPLLLLPLPLPLISLIRSFHLPFVSSPPFTLPLALPTARHMSSLPSVPFPRLLCVSSPRTFPCPSTASCLLPRPTELAPLSSPRPPRGALWWWWWCVAALQHLPRCHSLGGVLQAAFINWRASVSARLTKEGLQAHLAAPPPTSTSTTCPSTPSFTPRLLLFQLFIFPDCVSHLLYSFHLLSTLH